MSERNGFEMQMSPGAQPPSALGDRVLVGLAMVVLVAGALIALGNVLPDPEEVGQASAEPSERPARTPRPTPTPELPRIATLEAPDVEPSVPEQTYGFSGWIRALSDTVIRSSTDHNASEVGVLKAGEVAYADQLDQPADAPGWLSLQAPVGWIASREGGTERVRRYEYPRYRVSGWVGDLVAGAHGFVALAMPPAANDASTPGWVASSAEGASWRSTEPPFLWPWYQASIAWGPAGWLAAAFVGDEAEGRILVWNSLDGERWDPLGMLGGVSGEYVIRLFGSADGYLLETYAPQDYSGDQTIWSSADGQTWRESTDPLLQRAIVGERRITALEHGYYMSDGIDDPNRAAFGAFSQDGLTWSEIERVPDGIGLQLTELAGRIVAIDLDRTTLEPRAWSAELADGQVSWIRETASDAAFRGSVVRQVVSDGKRAYAFGWDRTTEEPLVWTGDGVHWLRSPLPEAFGALPSMAAAGPAGVVVIGSRHTLRGDNPIFWHRTAAGGWVPEAAPLLEVVPDPSADECPPLPRDILEYTVVDAAAIVACQGDATITLRAYSSACEGCWGMAEGNPQPAWLLSPTGNQLFLSPQPGGGINAGSVLAPAIAEPDPEWTDAWVEVTGHFDDPAALTCHRDPAVNEIQWWSGQAPLIEQCRETFVITAVTVVSGP